MPLNNQGDELFIPCLTPHGEDRVVNEEDTEADTLIDDNEGSQSKDREKFMNKVQILFHCKCNVSFNAKSTTMASKL